MTLREDQAVSIGLIRGCELQHAAIKHCEDVGDRQAGADMANIRALRLRENGLPDFDRAQSCSGVAHAAEIIGTSATRVNTALPAPFRTAPERKSSGNVFQVMALPVRSRMSRRARWSEALTPKPLPVDRLPTVITTFPLTAPETLESAMSMFTSCLLYTSDAADDLTRVDLGGGR